MGFAWHERGSVLMIECEIVFWGCICLLFFFVFFKWKWSWWESNSTCDAAFYTETNHTQQISSSCGYGWQLACCTDARKEDVDTICLPDTSVRYRGHLFPSRLSQEPLHHGDRYMPSAGQLLEMVGALVGRWFIVALLLKIWICTYCFRSHWYVHAGVIRESVW